MALIEHLDRDNWRDLLRKFFEHTLYVIKNDPFQQVGSAVDDLRAWIRQGGVSRIRYHLNNQMENLHFSDEKKKAVGDFLETLIQENRSKLIELVKQNSIPPERKGILLECGISEIDIVDILNRIMAGERPFEDWMHAHGYSDENIIEVYRVIDEWLMGQGIIPIPPSKIS